MKSLIRNFDLERNQTGQQRGLTLIEVLISIILVSSMLLVSLAASANLMRNSNSRRDIRQGQLLATQLLDEVTVMDYRDRNSPVFGLEADELGSDRTTFDDVDDYSGYTQSPPTARDNTQIEGYDGWTISIEVIPADWVTGGITTTTANAASPLRQVTVSCTSPDGVSTDASTLVAGLNRDLEETTSFEQWRRIRLSFPDRELEVVAPMRNQPVPTY